MRTQPHGDLDPPTLIFLHIAKTGGSTLQRIIRKNVEPSLVLAVPNEGPRGNRPPREDTIRVFMKRPESERAAARLVQGHTIFGIHEAIPRPSTYFTILRDPVALTVSHYRFVRRHPRHFLHEVASSLTLREFVESGWSLETDNSQARAISGDRETPFGSCDRTMLDLATANLQSRFSVVATTERFEEMLGMLYLEFGWARLGFIPANVSPGYQRKEEIDRSTIRLISELNAVDRELHAWGNRSMDRRIAADPAIMDATRRVRRANVAYRPFAEVTYALPRRVRNTLVRGRRH
jgi:hypothetical protein